MALLRTAYFGGSFDPPHNGHIALAKAVIELDLADEVWLSAAYIPPHKQRRLSDFSDRLAMLELVCRGLEKILPCGIEDQLKLNPSYTSEVLSELRRRYPEREFVLLIGEDMLTSFHLWHNARELLRDYRIICYPRGDGERASLSELRQHWSDGEAEKLLGSLLNDLPVYNISSTKIREAVAKNENVANCIDKEVYRYIKENGLYRKEN